MKEPVPRVNTKLTSALSNAGVADLLDKSIEIEVPALRRTVTAPYGYKNGRFNLVEPVRFDQTKSDSSFEKLCRRAIEGKLIYDQIDPKLGKLKMVVVGEFAPNRIEDIVPTRELLEEHAVSLYTFDYLEPLLEDIRKFAGC